MKRSFRIWCWSLLILLSQTTIGQTRKVTLQMLGGLGAIPVSESITETGQQKKIFGGFSPAIYLDLGGYYHFHSGLMLGASLQHFSTSKPNHTLTGNGGRLRVGYVFIPHPKHFWPYVFVGAGPSSILFQRQSYSETKSMDGVGLEGRAISVNEITYAFPATTYSYLTLGAEAGLGLDILLYRRWSFNVQLGVNYLLPANKGFAKEHLEQTPTGLPMLVGGVGVGYTLSFREKAKEEQHAYAKRDPSQRVRIRHGSGNHKHKDGENTKIPHANAFSANQVAAARPGYLSEPLSSHVIEKKALDPNKKFSILGKVHGSTKSSEVILLTDKNGNTKKVVSKNGFFAYTSLAPDDYEIKFESNDLHLRSEIKTIEDDGMMKLSEEEFKRFQYKRAKNDPFTNIVQGRIKNIKTGQYQDVDHTVILLNDKNEVVGRTIANKNGYFAFHKIKPDNYTALVETPDESLKAEIKVADSNPSLQLFGPDLRDYHYQALNRNETDGAIVIGKVLNAGQGKVEDATLLLVDSRGDVRVTKPNAQGNFAFKDLKHEDHQILVENRDPGIKVSVHPVADMTHMTASSYLMLKNNYHKLRGDAPNNVLSGKIDLKDQLKPAEDLEIMLLDEVGNVVKVTSPNKQGHFAFKDLKADDYKAVVNSSQARVSARLFEPVNDPELIIDPGTLKMYNSDSRSYEKLSPEDKLFVSGDVKEQGSQKPVEDQQVSLMDGDGRIEEVSKTDKNGNFTFENKKVGAYQVLFEGKENKQYQSKLELYRAATVSQSNSKRIETIYYATGSSSLAASDSVQLSQMVQKMQGLAVKLRVFAVPSEKETSKALNKKRVQDLRSRLIEKGIPADKIRIEDMGMPLRRSEAPAAKGDGPQKGRIEVFIEN